MADDERQEITDASDLRKYRIELPNMADDELGPFEFRLYGHYKRVCGAGDGVCWEAVRTTAEKTKMSAGQVYNSREVLARDGWIRVADNPNTKTKSIIIVDRWPENFERYSDVHQVNNSSPHERQRSPGEQARSPGETKNKPFKNKPRQKKKDISSEFPGGRFLMGKYADDIQH